MAPDNPTQLPDDAVETAIMHVLQAEAAARDAVAGARSAAGAIAEEARERARRVAVAADRRIAVMRAAFGARTAAEVASLDARAAALDAAGISTPDDVAKVETAVLALAASITGGAP
ncbi:MAG TPA: hypothetical protein VLU54_13700 [Casimicrobiaceae bacterium]|nr:hypothetical protein [Casimicrobiaceae bacterium]